MLKIVGVGSLGDDTIDIHLDNGSNILLELAHKLKEPEFAILLEGDRLSCPKTDGARVYWRDGPSLSLDEIMEMALGDKR